MMNDCLNLEAAEKSPYRHKQKSSW